MSEAKDQEAGRPAPPPRLSRFAREADDAAPARPLGRSTWLALGLILSLGILLRAWILLGPLGEVEADESVVGLMALHILGGEYPVFYWGQPYLGSLEAFLAAALFALVGPSNLALKLVPGLTYLGFVGLVFVGARRDYGDRAALLSALYLALPPSFLAFWSLKARGGYVELLLLGQTLFVLAPAVAARPRGWCLGLGLVGLVAGLLLWTHPLGLIFVVPTAAYLTLRLGRRLIGLPILAGLTGGLIGFGPVLVHNLATRGETFRALSTGGVTQQAFLDNLAQLAQVGLPVMVGLAQATSSPLLFAQDWPTRPGSRPWVPLLLLSVAALALLPAAFGLLPVLRGRRRLPPPTTFFGLAVLLLTPLLASLGRFGELVAEPRYALPLYAAVPLFALGASRLADRRPLVGLGVVILVLGLNLSSLATADPRLNLPTTAGGSTEASRARLLDYLERRGLTEIYTDYWLAYPLTFESAERVVASVTSGGYNRFPPFAHLVSVSENPAFVFIAGSPERAAFDARLRAAAARAEVEQMDIYAIYSAVTPLNPLRP